MNLMDMFRNIASPAAPNPAANPANNPALQTGNVRLDQSQAPANPLADPALQKPVDPPVDPLDAIGSIWELPKDAEAQLPKSITEFSFNFKPEDITKNARGIDFTKGMPQEILTDIAKGGEEAQAALLKAMNFVGQQAFANASLASARITEAGLRTAGGQMENNLPAAIRRESTSHMLREDNPLFASPAVQPVVQMLEAQAAAKYPGATPQQITEHVRKYFTTVISEGAKHLGVQVPGSEQTPQSKLASQAGDFSSWEV